MYSSNILAFYLVSASICATSLTLLSDVMWILEVVSCPCCLHYFPCFQTGTRGSNIQSRLSRTMYQMNTGSAWSSFRPNRKLFVFTSFIVFTEFTELIFKHFQILGLVKCSTGCFFLQRRDREFPEHFSPNAHPTLRCVGMIRLAYYDWSKQIRTF